MERSTGRGMTDTLSNSSYFEQTLNHSWAWWPNIKQIDRQFE
jgi:hypothetical protein